MKPTGAVICTRPSLASPQRLSVDIGIDGDIGRSYQGAFVTFESGEEAKKISDHIANELRGLGLKVSVEKSDQNPSRDQIDADEYANLPEEEIKKRLSVHIKKLMTPVKDVTLAKVLDIGNWPKIMKWLGKRSPQFVALLVIFAFMFHGWADDFIKLILPKEFKLNISTLLATSPALILLAAFFSNAERAEFSSENDRARRLILQAAVRCGWGRDRFAQLFLDEVQEPDYAPFMEASERLMTNWNTPIAELVAVQSVQRTLGEVKNKTPDDIVRDLIQGDFERKVQALASVANEPGYRANRLPILPLFLIASLDGVKATIQTIGAAGNPKVPDVRKFQDAMYLLGTLFGVAAGIGLVIPALILAIIAAYQASLALFAMGIVISIMTLWVLLRRPFAVVFGRKCYPVGLALHECRGAILI